MREPQILLDHTDGEVAFTDPVILRVRSMESPEFCTKWRDYNAVQMRPSSKWGSPQSIFVSAHWSDMKTPLDADKIGRLFTEEVEITGRLVVEPRRPDGTRSSRLFDWDVLPPKPTAPAASPQPLGRSRRASYDRPVSPSVKARMAAKMAEEFFRCRQKDADRKAIEEAKRAAWRAACPPPENLIAMRQEALKSCQPDPGQSMQDMLWRIFDYPDRSLPPLALAWQVVASAMLLVWGEAGTDSPHSPGADEAHMVRHNLKYGEKKTLEKMGLPIDGPVWSADADDHGGLCGFSD